MLGAIPNPKKSFDVDFSSQKIIDTIPYIPLVNNKYKFTSKNDVLKTYRFEALEFLSLGIYVDISISTISDSRSKIEIEVSRKIGAFDQSFEVVEYKYKEGRYLDILNTGDSRCVLCTDNVAISKTKDHKPNAIEEFEHEGDVYIKFKPSDGYTSSKPKNQTQPTP